MGKCVEERGGEAEEPEGQRNENLPSPSISLLFLTHFSVAINRFASPEVSFLLLSHPLCPSVGGEISF